MSASKKNRREVIRGHLRSQIWNKSQSPGHERSPKVKNHEKKSKKTNLNFVEQTQSIGTN